MRFNFKKTTAILMSTLAISGTVLPAVADNKQFDTSIATEDTLTVAFGSQGFPPCFSRATMNGASQRCPWHPIPPALCHAVDKAASVRAIAA